MKQRVRYTIKWLFVLMLLFSFFGTAVRASSLEDNVLPESKKQEGAVTLKSGEHPVSSYALDLHIDKTKNPFNISGKIDDGIQATRLEFLNSAWVFIVIIVNFVILVVGEAFKLDFIDSIIAQIAESIRTISGFKNGTFQENGLWSILAIFMVALVGAWAIYVGMIKRQQSKATSGMLSMLLVFVFSLGFFSQADKVLTGLNDFSKEMQNSVMNISGNVVSSGSGYTGYEGIASMQNQMFDIMVYKPFMFMQFGDSTGDPAILALNYGSEERAKFVESQVKSGNKMMGVEGLGSRTWFIILLFISNLMLGSMMLLMAAAVLLYQVIFIAMVLFSPVPLLMALVPAWQGKAFEWAMKTLHALLMKVGFALLMTVIFTISKVLYAAVGETTYGYLFVLGMQILVFFGVWWKRQELLSFINTATANISSTTRGSLDSFRDYSSRMGRAMDAVPGSRAAAGLAGVAARRTGSKGFDLVSRAGKFGAKKTVQAGHALYNRSRKFDLPNQGIKTDQEEYAATGTSGASSSGNAMPAGPEYVTPDFVDRRNPNALPHNKKGPNIIDADYSIVEDPKQIGGGVKVLPFGTTASSAAKQQAKRAAAISPALNAGPVDRNISPAIVDRDLSNAPTISSVRHVPVSQENSNSVIPLVTRTDRTTNAGPAAGAVPGTVTPIPAIPRDGSRVGQEIRTGSESEIVNRSTNAHVVTSRNDNMSQLDNQVVNRDVSRETSRNQFATQLDKQNVNEVVNRSNTEDRTVQRNENNAQKQNITETTNRNTTGNQNLVRNMNETNNKTTTENQNTVRNTNESNNRTTNENQNTVRNQTVNENRKKTQNEEVNKNLNENTNTIVNENRNVKQTVQQTHTENKNIVRDENTSKTVNELHETNNAENISRTDRQNSSTFINRVVEQNEVREDGSSESQPPASGETDRKGRRWFPWGRKER
ncbi:hypothetical protein B9G55_23845 [Saccharibacillus sp. O16]|nr:hypothetical protein B9G55_23845 [Saccharibacillus sp. O16]